MVLRGVECHSEGLGGIICGSSVGRSGHWGVGYSEAAAYHTDRVPGWERMLSEEIISGMAGIESEIVVTERSPETHDLLSTAQPMRVKSPVAREVARRRLSASIRSRPVGTGMTYGRSSCDADAAAPGACGLAHHRLSSSLSLSP